MNYVLRIVRLKIALQRAFLGRAILIFTAINVYRITVFNVKSVSSNLLKLF